MVSAGRAAPRRAAAHGGRPPPLRIEHDVAADTVRIDGLCYSGAFFRAFACPSPDARYRIVREGDVVRVERVPG